MKNHERISLCTMLMVAGTLALGCGEDGRDVMGGGTSSGFGSSTDDGAGSESGTMDGTTALPDDTTGGEVGPGVDLQCGGQGGADVDDGVICFYDVEAKDKGPAANLEYALVDLDGQPAIYVKVVFATWFVDNTYGDNAIGWDDGHKFKDLVGSDRANIVMRNAEGEVVLDFDLDYLEEDEDASSGFRSMGVWKKNGEMHTGDPSAILAANSSLSRNLNERGYGELIKDSPATDDQYTPNPAAPDWDFRVVYEVWVDASLFTQDGAGAFAEACVLSIHASPSKLGENTREVVPDECPPGWGCFEEEDGCAECEPSAHQDPDMSEDCDPTDGIPAVP